MQHGVALTLKIQLELVKSTVKDIKYGKSKIHTNVEFTFSNNTFFKGDFFVFILVLYYLRRMILSYKLK